MAPPLQLIVEDTGPTSIGIRIKTSGSAHRDRGLAFVAELSERLEGKPMPPSSLSIVSMSNCQFLRSISFLEVL